MVDANPKRYWSARYERCFRTVVVDENDFTIMEAILSTILGGKVSIVSYLLPNINVDTTEEKQKTVDLMIQLDGEYINLELETGTSLETTLKNFNYFISMYKKNVVRNNKYDTKTKFLQIILQFGLSNSSPLFEEFFIQSEENVLIPNFKIIRVNMDRITKMCYSKNTLDIEKYKYLIMLDLPKNELENFKGDDEIVAEFKSKIFHLNENERFQNDMTKEEEEALVINTGKALAFEEGEASGMVIGMEQGEKKKQLEIAKKLISMDMPLEQISITTELSLEEIQSLKEELQ